MEFYRDKGKSKKLILLCSGILLLMVVIFLYGLGLFTGTISAKLVAVSGIFGLILTFIIIRKVISLQDTAPLVILNNQGIISKVTGVSKAAGLILWEDIVDITIEKVGADTLVTLSVDQPDNYIARIKKKLSAMMVNGILDENGNLPISLTAAELTVDATELFNAITTFRKDLVHAAH